MKYSNHISEMIYRGSNIILLPLLSLIIFACNISAQDYDLDWTVNIGNIADNYGFDIGSDSLGNTYVTGTYRESLNFGGTILNSIGTADLFIAKFNRKGQLVWANSAGGNSSFYDGAFSIATDQEENVYLTGKIYGTGIFNGDTLIHGTNSYNSFICKYDAAGSLCWVKQIGGDDDDNGVEIRLDSEGNITLLSLSMSELMRFDDENSIEGNSFGAVYISKYTPNGDLIWARKIIDKIYSVGFGFGIDQQDNIYVSGEFPFSAIFNNITVVSKGFNDIFLAKYDDSGNLIWLKQAGGKADDWCNGLSIGSSGNIYITGHYQDTIRFDALELINSNIQEDIHTSTTDVFVAKYNADGNIDWVLSGGDGDKDESYDIALTKDESIFIVGRFQDTLKYANQSIKSNGLYDIFLTQIDSSGNHISTSAYGGDSESIFADRCWSIDINNREAISITGNFHGTMQFEDNSITSNGQHDIFITKWTLPKTGISENDSLQSLVYPNPTFGKLYLEMNQVHESLFVDLFSESGQLIQQKQFINTDLIELQIEGPAGVYVVTISDDNDFHESYKVIKLDGD